VEIYTHLKEAEEGTSPAIEYFLERWILPVRSATGSKMATRLFRGMSRCRFDMPSKGLSSTRHSKQRRLRQLSLFQGGVH
jgi:hypothetical protein